MIGRWMKECPRWNLVLLCPEGEDRRSLVRDLKTSDHTIEHGAWGFTPETSMRKRSITFDEQEVFAVQEIGDIIFIMVYPEASNPIENIRSGCKTVPRMFYDHTSKYPTMQWDKKRRTPEEIVRLIDAYLPKEWALVLVNLSTSVQAITEEGFIGSRILILDGNGQRSQKLADWICEHKEFILSILLRKLPKQKNELDHMIRDPVLQRWRNLSEWVANVLRTILIFQTVVGGMLRS